jgi:mono/diheme cytochrome c family protein
VIPRPTGCRKLDRRVAPGDPSGMKASFRLLAVLFAAACGSKSPAPAAPAGEAEVVLPDVAFDKLDHEQRIAFMKQKVMPAMTPIFQHHDPKDFAEFGCKTCHGPDAKERKFEMPNPGLPKLNFKDLSKFKKEDLEWMGKEVMPTMAKLLGEEPYSDANPKGFGCLECHTQEGA